MIYKGKESLKLSAMSDQQKTKNEQRKVNS